MKSIENYTADELSAKIEKMANALKKYEEELERRKQEVPLGVPDRKRNKTYWYLTGSFEIDDCIDEDDLLDKRLFEVMNYFSSKESAQKHAEMLFEWRQTLVAIVKGEQIDIKVLLPLLKKGKVLYSPYDEKWKWVEQEAVVFAEKNGWYIKQSQVFPIEGFNLKPAENWEDSLMECGL